MTSTTNLFNPLSIGDITIRNRIGMSAMSRNRAVGTVPTDLMAEYYAQRAAGGTGLIVTEGILITRQGTELPWAPGIWNSDQVAGWKKITEVVHSVGGSIYAQLWHLGRLSHPDAPEQILAGVPVYAPSAISARGGEFPNIPGHPGYVTPTAIEDPWDLVKLYKVAAINAKEAGFDGVELHAWAGCLIAQFLDNSANLRTDKWGGSVKNRARFGLEVLGVLVQVFGRNVSAKIGPCGGAGDVGMPLQETLDTFSYFFTEADKMMLSYIVLVRYFPLSDVEYDGKKRATVHDVVKSYRGLIKNSKAFTNGAVSPEEGESLVGSGEVDGIFMAFPFIAHPDLVKRVEQAKPLDNTTDVNHILGHEGEDLRVGYTDYPLATDYTVLGYLETILDGIRNLI